jgi:hypothetical protein
LFIAGDVHACSRPLARLLAGRRANSGATLLRAAGKEDLALLTQLVNAGHLALVDARPAGRRAVPSR